MTDRMIGVLRVLAEEQDRDPPMSGRMTGNEMGRALGFEHGMEGRRFAHDGRRMGPANRVNFAVSRLRDLGYVAMRRRPDGLSGTAYEITKQGREALAQALFPEIK